MATAVAMTFDNLCTDVANYLERTDTVTVNQIPSFIMLAEQVLAAELKFLGNLNTQTSTMTANDSTLTKPARWRKTVSMNITVAGVRQPVLLRKYEFLRNYWPNNTSTGTPVYYADYDYNHWLVAPTPDAAYTFDILYYERIQPLDSTNQTNWWTQNAPQALLYGTLLQAMAWVKNDDRIPMWKSQYETIVAYLKSEDQARLADRQAVALDS
jgi:hypothetical protein